ncbi:hypothetical protein A0O36_01832 [Piscirickettsiaceae bacterium NZ-RLO1]|nr:hypothetical protein A0O36_01832 [Piscirickettsiaceae bacterium NZ-RLO1]
MLDNPWKFYGSYACLSSIYDEIQQIYEGIKAHITAENWQPSVDVQFNQYRSQVMQAVFELRPPSSEVQHSVESSYSYR